jgi:membrane protease YdiL (CAAX protease family)
MRASPTDGFWKKLLRLAPVRIVLGLFSIIIVVSLVQLPFKWLEQAVPALRPLFNFTLLPAIVAAAAALVAYYFFVRWTERRPVSELGFNGALPEVGAGALLGVAMFALTMVILWVCGTYRFTGTGPWQPLITALAGASTAAIIEELLFRGVIFRITEQSLGTWFALVISAILFGALHFLNPHSGLTPAIAIALEAGLFLAAAYLVTRRLWFVIGAHFAWNFTEGGIFGLSVSGQQAKGGLFHGYLSGSTFLSGGAFGVEASAVAVLVCLISAAILVVYTSRRGLFIQPFWARANPSAA